jgi:hypothetical protein
VRVSFWSIRVGLPPALFFSFFLNTRFSLFRSPLGVLSTFFFLLHSCALVTRSGDRYWLGASAGVGGFIVVADERERRRDCRRVPAYLARLLRWYAPFNRLLVFFSFFLTLFLTQKRLRSMEGSRWRPFLCSRASIASLDGGSARFRRRLTSASSSGRSLSLCSFLFSPDLILPESLTN